MRRIAFWCLLGMMLTMTHEAGAQHAQTGRSSAMTPQTGVWRAWLQTPGGDLPFEIEIINEEGRWRAVIINAGEFIEINEMSAGEGVVEFAFPHYDSTIRGTVSESGDRIVGTWTKRRGLDRWARLPFRAEFGFVDRFPTESQRDPTRMSEFSKRFRVKFEDDDQFAVATFHARADGVAQGTFLTTTGDYRFLGGNIDSDELRLSAFDGSHAFLFHAQLKAGGSLEGTFWSGDWYSVGWTATPDETVTLPDPFALTRAREGISLDSLVFKDLEGNPVSVGDPRFTGHARLIVLFGSWCPNCHDASNYLVELNDRYADEGLSVLGLAFEVTGQFDRDVEQVRRYIQHHNVTYPVLLAGLSDKAKASQVMPVLDRVRAYPTTLFVDAEGNVREIHTGFSGPATGETHTQLKARFEAIIERLLAEAREPSNTGGSP